MFTMDVPSVPVQQTPIVLAQAATPATPRFDYILKDCQEAEQVSTTFNAISPEGMLAVYLGNRSNRDILSDTAALASIKTTLLEGTAHGKITSEGVYIPEPNYFGKDKVVFMAEFEGKRYKIILDIHVVAKVDEGDSPTTTCPPPKLIKVNGKPVSGASDYNFNSVSVTFADLTGGALGQTTGSTITLDTTAAGNNWFIDTAASAYSLSASVLNTLSVDPSLVTFNLADLPGAALGQTTGSTITLDTNAAGYNWFIDTTPGSNEEFLPTSNPNEWVAKAGSAAAGKMDMLSVLLHEYGHALGINHSAAPNDFMGRRVW